MQKTIFIDGLELFYELEIKQVKNINLRIRPDGTIHVSASRRHTMRQIEALFHANETMILRALQRAARLQENASSIPRLSRAREGQTAEAVVRRYCGRIYPRFAAICGGSMPEIRFRQMKSRWGSCAPKERILTFNTRLAYVPEHCVEYVVVHEFCHFLYPNHSAAFYAAVASVLPDWKASRSALRNYEGLMA